MALNRLLAEARIPADQFAYRLNALAYAIHDGANCNTVVFQRTGCGAR